MDNHVPAVRMGRVLHRTTGRALACSDRGIDEMRARLGQENVQLVDNELMAGDLLSRGVSECQFAGCYGTKVLGESHQAEAEKTEAKPVTLTCPNCGTLLHGGRCPQCEWSASD